MPAGDDSRYSEGGTSLTNDRRLVIDYFVAFKC